MGVEKHECAMLAGLNSVDGLIVPPVIDSEQSGHCAAEDITDVSDSSCITSSSN